MWQKLPKVRGAPVFQPKPLPPCDWKAPSTSDLPSLRGLKRISFDIETHDENLEELGPGTRRGSYVVGIALGTEDGRRWYFPTRHEGGGNMDEAQVKRWAHHELNNFDGEVIGAHIIYELEFMAMPEWDVTFRNTKGFHDVLLAEPLIDEWRRDGYSLDAVGTYHFGNAGRKATEMLEAAALCMGGWRTDRQVKSNLWRFPAAYVGAYGEGDADRPLRILEKQLAIIEKDRLSEVYDVERGLIPLLLAMRLRGVPVNMARAEEVNARMLTERDQCLARVRHLAGPQAELMAPESFANALRDRGLEIPLTAKTRKPSITKGWLKQYEGKDALVDAIQAGRRVEKIINTYTGTIARYAVNGRIYAEFPQLKGEDGGTIARFSSKSPNLQNQPARDEELGPLTRSVFEPEQGEVWERQDASQIEFRLLVNYSALAKDKYGQPLKGAEEARLAYTNDPTTDFHALTATILGVDPADSFVRKRVKNVNFGSVYFGGEETIARTMGCSVQEARDFLAKYHARLPFVRGIGIVAMDIARERGEIRTLLNRAQRFTLYEPRHQRVKPGDKKERKAQMLPYDEAVRTFGANNVQRAFCHAGLNRALQGSAADILKKGMLDIWRSGVCDVLGAPLVTVHDELGLSVPQTPSGNEAAAYARRCMETAIKLCVPLRVDYSQGANWGECK